MRTIVAAVAAGLLALLSGAAMAASLNVLETDPPSPATLASGENFFVRFALEDPEPTRVQVRALHRGSAVADLFTSTPRPLPAGGGTEVAFIFLRPKNAPVEVDEIVLSVARESQTLTGAPAESFSMPVQLTWSTAPTTAARPEPRWLGEHRAAETVRVREAVTAARHKPKGSWLAEIGVMALSAVFIVLAVAAIWLPLRAYRRWDGGWSVAAAACTVPTLYVVIGIVLDLLGDPTTHNLWPVELAIALPITLAAFTLVSLAYRLRH